MTAPDVRAQTADLIEQAIDLLHERGWCQNALQDSGGRICVVGALEEAAVAIALENGTSVAAEPDPCAMEELDATAEMQVDSFNDLSHTTFEDVLLVMKRAAASLREPRP